MENKNCVLGKMNKNVMANVIGDYWLPDKHQSHLKIDFGRVINNSARKRQHIEDSPYDFV